MRRPQFRPKLLFKKTTRKPHNIHTISQTYTTHQMAHNGGSILFNLFENMGKSGRRT